MDIQFSGRDDQKQYYQGVFLAYKPPTREAALRILGFVLVITLYGVIVFDVLQQDTQSAGDLTKLFSYLLTILVLSTFILQPYIKAFTQSRGLWKDPITRTPISGTISSQGVSFGAAHALSWDAFIKVGKTEDLIVLLTTDGGMVILPRSFFASARDWETLQQWIDRYVKVVQ